MSGYIKLWRQSLKSKIWQNHNLWRFWIWCLLKASYKEHTMMVGYKEVTLQPGDFIFGRTKASEETGLSERNIRTNLAFLKKSQNLTIKTTSKFSIISIVNWQVYQEEATSTTTSKRPANDQQTTTNNKVKKVNKVKKEENTGISPSSSEEGLKELEEIMRKSHSTLNKFPINGGEA